MNISKKFSTKAKNVGTFFLFAGPSLFFFVMAISQSLSSPRTWRSLTIPEYAFWHFGGIDMSLKINGGKKYEKKRKGFSASACRGFNGQ